jgi:hypothetical protein
MEWEGLQYCIPFEVPSEQQNFNSFVTISIVDMYLHNYSNTFFGIEI